MLPIKAPCDSQCTMQMWHPWSDVASTADLDRRRRRVESSNDRQDTGLRNATPERHLVYGIRSTQAASLSLITWIRSMEMLSFLFFLAICCFFPWTISVSSFYPGSYRFYKAHSQAQDFIFYRWHFMDLCRSGCGASSSLCLELFEVDARLVCIHMTSSWLTTWHLGTVKEKLHQAS